MPATHHAAKATRATDERPQRMVKDIFGTARDHAAGSWNRLQIAGSLPEKRVTFSYLLPCAGRAESWACAQGTTGPRVPRPNLQEASIVG